MSMPKQAFQALMQDPVLSACRIIVSHKMGSKICCCCVRIVNQTFGGLCFDFVLIMSLGACLKLCQL